MCSVQESDGILSNSMPIPIGCEFELDRPPVEYFESEIYNCCLLCKYDDEFANFVFENRVQLRAVYTFNTPCGERKELML